MKKRVLLKFLLLCIIVCTSFIAGCYLYIQKSNEQICFSHPDKIPPSYTVIVPGALVRANGIPSGILMDRLDVAAELYKSGKVRRFLLTGDHGTIKYDEVNNMKEYLHKLGVPDTVIFLDHAGFDTHSSMVRAAKVFQVTDAVIVNQEMYLKRSLYLAKNAGLNATGIGCDRHRYGGRLTRKLREIIACSKAVLEINFQVAPKFLGNPIPITGDSRKSYDR